MSLQPGARVDDYEVLRRAAAGATSEVYEGRHVRDGRRVALKVLREEWCPHEEVVSRFLNEASALQHIKHPHVVTAFGSGFLSAGPPFLILEWLPFDLDRALVSSGGRVGASTAARVVAQVAGALAALHEHGMIHRDLKPGNVLADREDLSVATLKIADLGLAKVTAATVVPWRGAGEVPAILPISTGGGALFGTWDYMAPEQWMRSKDVTPKTDVYALGALLFQLLTGQPPFVAEQQRDLMYLHLFEAPPLYLLRELASVAEGALVARMLSKSPPDRPTMRDVEERLTCAR